MSKHTNDAYKDKQTFIDKHKQTHKDNSEMKIW